MTEEQVFLAAVELPDHASRTAYLDEVCGANGELRQQVEQLLAAHERSGKFLDVPAAAQLAARSHPHRDETVVMNGESDDAVADMRVQHPAPRDDADDDLGFLSPPTRPDSLGRLGHYEMLQVLGKGGFGIVFRAFDDILQRVVALKVMAPQIATLSPARKRFVREAQSSAQVRHENVVQVYEVGEQPLPYLTMEFIPGETLQQKLDRCGPLDVPETLRIGRQIAEGLAAAHTCDLIHRDIKPSNVLLDGGSHKAKITDFGLARAADDASMSQSGVVAGTPMYMAPEQALGHKIDQRVDLFSLGSVLYQMVSGRPPFRAPSTLAVLKRVAEEQPRPIQEIIPETPDWLCGIIAKLHAKNPEERFQSAREVADLLADCEAKLKAKQEVKNVLPLPAKPAGRRAGWRWAGVAAVLVLPVLALAVTEFTGVTNYFRGQQATAEPTKPGVQPPQLGTPQTAAEVLRFLEGSWSVKREELGPKAVPDEAERMGEMTFDFVAGGSILRGRGGPANEFGQPHFLYSFDAKQGLRRWVAWSGGEAFGPIVGSFNPESRTLLWMHRIATGGQSNVEMHFIDRDTVKARTFRLDPNDKLTRETRLIFTRLKRPASLAELPIDPARTPEMMVLDRLVGEWRDEITVAISGTPDQPKKEVQWTQTQPVLGGRMIEMISTNETTSGSDYSLLWYDVAAKRYRLWAFLGSGQAFELGGTWDEASKTIALASPDGSRFGHMVFNSDDQFEFRRAGKNATGKIVFDATGVTQRIASPGFTALFNTKDLDGWNPFPADKWKVVNGEIVGEGLQKPRYPNLYTNTLFGDFHLRAEVKLNDTDKGRAGLIVRNAGTTHAQIVLGVGVPGERTGSLRLYEEGTVTWPAKFGENLFAPNTWFTLEVIVRGKDITVKVNGTQTAQATVAKIPDRGVVGLVVTQQTVVHCRKFEIKELPAQGTATTGLPETPEQVLPALAGAWKGEYTQKIYGGKPDVKKLSAVAVNDWIVGNKWLRQRVQIENEGFQSVTSYDPNAKTFRDWFFHSRGLIFGPSTGRWDSATRTITWTNLPEDGIILLMTFRFIDADSYTGEILIRDKEGKTVFEMSSLMKRTTESVTIDENTAAGPLPPEMAALDQLVGSWQVDAIIKDAENPAGLKAAWQKKAWKILGGRVIVSQQTGGQYQSKDAYSLTTFDAYAKAYRRYLFLRDGNVLDYGGAWDEMTQTMKWHWAGKDGSQSSNTWRFVDADRHDWQVVTKDALGKTTLDVQGTATRQGRVSAISYQLSAISYQLSAISYQLSAISIQLPLKLIAGCCSLPLELKADR